VREVPARGDGTSDGLDELLDYIRRARRFDFTGYKRPSLARRITKRVQDVGCTTFADYQDYLEVHPEEFAALFDTVLINVTGFFRDAAAWEFLADEIIPRIVTAKAPGIPIRVWSAGCATGEEAYTLAILLCESLGAEQFQARVKIYGTDADEGALARARQAVYGLKELRNVPEELRSRYFDDCNGGPNGLVFRNDLRRQVIFGRHDLVQDAPISRLDLLVCRNTLMYFNAETQSTILERFNFALGDGGYLFLGKAETLLTHSPLFRPVDLRLRVFTKPAEGGSSKRSVLLLGAEADDPPLPSDVLALALDLVSVPSIIVDVEGTVVSVNVAARNRFGLRPRDVGSAIQDLEISYRPVELRSAIAEANAEGRSVTRSGVHWRFDGVEMLFDVTVTPIAVPGGAPLGTTISFIDVTEAHQLRTDLEQTTRDLETAYEELQSTNEELETTNEELQSTIEELETTNEELQSSNEELETTNEELQSTNDQLQSVNEELQVSSAQIDRANAFLEGILSGVHQGVVVLDRSAAVQVWNRWAEDLWGLRADEVRGMTFDDLDIGLPVRKLRSSISACLEGRGDTHARVLASRNRKGQSIDCRVLCTPLSLDGTVDGVIMVMEKADAPAQ
jgi:two-component system CheB/CheR fusion protein